jgi:hypothetical protein
MFYLQKMSDFFTKKNIQSLDYQIDSQAIFFIKKIDLSLASKIHFMTKKELIAIINTAFENVKLEDGIGLWEGQGIDDYADLEKILELKKKDEREDWNNIPYQDLMDCSSSLSFLDAKGMRFCLPKFMMFDLLADEIFEEGNNYSPDPTFTLGYELDGDYQKNRFSLFNQQQIQAVIHFLEYNLKDFVTKHQARSENKDSVYSNAEYLELKRTIEEWKQKLG